MCVRPYAGAGEEEGIIKEEMVFGGRLRDIFFFIWTRVAPVM